jgi:glycosyltransferase involved in cell wall biosynthesis
MLACCRRPTDVPADISSSKVAPTVSIVIPCYNGAAFLAQTLGSAVWQSRPPLEVIVIDDGSTDNSAAIAEQMGPPVRVIRQTNHGESVARNRGLAEAKGSHVLFLDADDLLARDALLHLAGALDGKPYALAIMGCAFFTDNPERPFATNENHYERFYPGIIGTNFGPPLCWLSPIDVIRRAGGFCEGLHWFEDWDLWWRVGLEDPELIPVEYVGARYRQHAHSQLSTTSAANRARGHAVLMERMTEAFLQRPDLLARYGDVVFWSAWTALKRAKEARVPWTELGALQRWLQQLAEEGPAPVKRSSTALAIRWFGTRLAAAIR